MTYHIREEYMYVRTSRMNKHQQISFEITLLSLLLVLKAVIIRDELEEGGAVEKKDVYIE